MRYIAKAWRGILELITMNLQIVHMPFLPLLKCFPTKFTLQQWTRIDDVDANTQKPSSLLLDKIRHKGLREDVKKNPDYLVTLIIFPLTPTHLPPRMTYDKSD